MSKKNPRKKRNALKKLSKFLILTGLVCLVISLFLFWQRNNPKRLAFDTQPSAYSVNNTAKTPQRIMIDSLKIDLPLIPAKLDNNKWEVTDKGVSYLVSTPPPGEQGNSVLYGHNWSNLLGKITKLKPNQEVKIIYSDGTVNKFKITSTAVVSPEDASVLAPSKNKKITLYTCTGFLDTKRFIVSAELI